MSLDKVTEIVLSYSKVQERLKDAPQDKDKVIKILKEIQGDFSPNVVKTALSFIDKTFLRLYDGVKLEVQDNFDIRELQKKHNVILVPNHQSHADYVALTYLLFKKFQVQVHVAAGINLNIFPVGQLFKKCGAFFIRRSFNSDHFYKSTFEAYIYYLLKSDYLLEFFFEGGRSRTGKLLPPKFGLFSIILEAHSRLDTEKPLMFLPVAIAHEHIPEEKAHAKELSGAKKEKENPTQLLKLLKLFNKKLGTVHVRIGKGIVVEKVTDLRAQTQAIAFECFKAVGKEMPVTPTSLLCLVMLDDPSGALTWKQIEERARDVVSFCHQFKIPLTESLEGDENISCSLRKAMDMFINNKKVDVIKREKLNQIFYAIKNESRVELLFHKNMILHHFLVPGLMNATWFNIFNGSIKTERDLTKFLLAKRKELKYEFYLPSTREMIEFAVKIISYALGRNIVHLSEGLSLSSQELYEIAHKVRRYSTAFSYIYEGYYLSAISVKYLATDSFNFDKYLQVARELFTMELEHGRVIKYPESFTVPMMSDTLKYLENLAVITKDETGIYSVKDLELLNKLIEKFARDLNDQVSINLKFNKV